MVTYTLPLGAEPTEVLRYTQADGYQPFTAWHNAQKDKRVKEAINARIGRLRLGLYGDHRFIDGDVWELRIHFGAGCRLYFLKDGGRLIVLLCGGNKSSQRRDIARAQRCAFEYWRNK
jgi:putative addiction module killer protein